MKFFLYIQIFPHLVSFGSTGVPLAEIAKLTAPDGVAGNVFGFAVVYTDDFLVMGSHDDQQAGSVYVFLRDQVNGCEWAFLKKIPSPQSLQQSRFSSSLSIFGNQLLVRANSDDEKPRNSGVAFLYGRNQGGENNWGLIKKIKASDGSESDVFSKIIRIYRRSTGWFCTTKRQCAGSRLSIDGFSECEHSKQLLQRGFGNGSSQERQRS